MTTAEERDELRALAVKSAVHWGHHDIVTAKRALGELLEELEEHETCEHGASFSEDCERCEELEDGDEPDELDVDDEEE